MTGFITYYTCSTPQNVYDLIFVDPTTKSQIRVIWSRLFIIGIFQKYVISKM